MLFGKHARIAFVVALAFALLMIPAWVSAQQVSGTITGYVTDPSGDGVPGAVVTIANVLTGVKTEKPTDSAGLYLAPNLIPGKYSITVSASGFEKFVRENVILNVDS